MNEDLIRQTVEAVLNGSAKTLPCTEMNLKLATALIAKVEEKAKQQNLAVVVAVADKAGRPVAIHCMDDAYIGSFDVALNKSFTSAAFKMSTKKLGELSQPNQSLYGIQFTNQGKVVIFGGGEPLTVGDRIIGALGVSGGSAQQDTDLAAYGKEILKEVISCLQ